MRTVAIAVMIALALTAIPAIVPAAAELSPVSGADARPPCVIGPDSCMIPMYCVTDPCPSYP